MMNNEQPEPTAGAEEPLDGIKPVPKRFGTILGVMKRIHPRISKPFFKGRTRPIIQFGVDGLPKLVGFRRPASGVDVILSRAILLAIDHPFVRAAKYKLELKATTRGIVSRVKGEVDHV
jgi:hypothetical protein